MAGDELENTNMASPQDIYFHLYINIFYFVLFLNTFSF